MLDDQDRVLFEEAARSAQAGALRGAYILVWLSCAESLKRRFRAAAPRDGKAKKVMGEAERREADHRAVDLFLLAEAMTYGFVSGSGHTRLKSLYEHRCLYGHPYEESPSAETLIAAAATVVELVLGQPVRLRHGYLDAQIRSLTEEKTFLDDQEDAVAEFSEEVRRRSDPALHEWFIKKLWKELEDMAGDASMGLYYRRGVWFAQHFLEEGAGVHTSWQLVDALTEYRCSASATLARASLFTAIGRQEQDVLVGLLIDRAQKQVSTLTRLESLDRAGSLSDRQRERFRVAVSDFDLSNLSSSGLSLRYTYPEVLAGLESHNWYSQNPAARAVLRAGPEGVAELAVSDQFILGNNILQAAEGGSRGSQKLLEALDDETPSIGWPPEFLRGLVFECFVNDRGEVRFKLRKAKEAAGTLRLLGDQARSEVCSGLAKAIQEGTPKTWLIDEDDRDRLVKILTALVESGEETFAPLEPVIMAVGAVPLEAED